MNGRRTVLAVAMTAVAILALFAAVTTAKAAGSGTTLSATVNATAHYTNTFKWTIDKQAAPATLSLFRGDSGTSDYTVKLTKDSGTLATWLDGQISVTNGGAVATQNLAITVNVTMPPSSTVIASAPVDVSAMPVLQPNSTYVYAYKLTIPSASVVPSGNYKVTAHITITNHSGHTGPFGPSPSATAILPASPTPVHDSVNVSDTVKGSLGTFSTGGTAATYSQTYSCDADQGDHKNTASITYADDNTAGPSASATVTVNCYALEVTKTANTAFTRTYTWSISKSVDQSSLTLAVCDTATVNYTATVDATYADSAWKVDGDITVHNPAPIAATINSVADAISGMSDPASVDCGVTFPYTLAAGQDLNCSYSSTLPDAATRTNTATATLQNTPSGTTDFTGTASVDFTNASMTEIDKSVSVSDSLYGSLGTVTYGTVTLPEAITYPWVVGPYNAAGTYYVNNTVTFTTNDTKTTDSASAQVTITVPSAGCSLTIGYWKNHLTAADVHGDQPYAGEFLPIWLGTANTGKSVEVTTTGQAGDILSVTTSNSNGISKLYAQLLATKLSVASGWHPSADVTSAMSQADGILAQYNSSDWSSLSSQQQTDISNLQNQLSTYLNASDCTLQ